MKYKSLILVFVIFSACTLGKKEIEEDKFPDWDEFPNIKSKGISVNILPYEFINIKYFESFIFSHCVEKKLGSKENLNYLIVFNHSLEVIEKLPLKRNFSGLTLKNKYLKKHLTFKRFKDKIYISEENNDVLYVFDINTSNFGRIPSLLSNDEFSKKYNVLHDTLKKGYLLRKIMDSNDCVLKLNSSPFNAYIPKLNNNRDFFIPLNISSNKKLQKKEKEIEFCGEDLLLDNNKINDLKFLGDAVLGNHSSGNHYYYYYIPFGYKYYHLSSKNIDLKFKFNSRDLSNENLKYVSSSKNKIFLLNSSNGKIYQVSLIN